MCKSSSFRRRRDRGDANDFPHWFAAAQMADFVSVHSYPALPSPILHLTLIFHTACLPLSPVYLSSRTMEACGPCCPCVRAICPEKVWTIRMPVLSPESHDINERREERLTDMQRAGPSCSMVGSGGRTVTHLWPFPCRLAFQLCSGSGAYVEV